jgi:hypothetical protein
LKNGKAKSLPTFKDIFASSRVSSERNETLSDNSDDNSSTTTTSMNLILKDSDNIPLKISLKENRVPLSDKKSAQQQQQQTPRFLDYFFKKNDSDPVSTPPPPPTQTTSASSTLVGAAATIGAETASKIMKENIFLNKPVYPVIKNEPDLDRTKASSPKCLPRLLCRNRGNMTAGCKQIVKVNSSNIQQTFNTQNKTNLIFKSLDTLFENNKFFLKQQQQQQHQQQQKDRFDHISSHFLQFRPSEISSDAKLYDNENAYFANKIASTVNSKYPFYDPFKDESLVLDSYKLVNSRNVVDCVGDILNDMISVVCNHEQNKTKRKEMSNCDETTSNGQKSGVEAVSGLLETTTADENNVSGTTVNKPKTNIIILNKSRNNAIVNSSGNSKCFTQYYIGFI